MATINLLPMDFKLSLHNVLFGQSEFLATEQAYLKICVLVPIQHIFVPARSIASKTWKQLYS